MANAKHIGNGNRLFDWFIAIAMVTDFFLVIETLGESRNSLTDYESGWFNFVCLFVCLFVFIMLIQCGCQVGSILFVCLFVCLFIMFHRYIIKILTCSRMQSTALRSWGKKFN